MQTLRQLLEHEALVHSATKRNGRAQPLLTSLGLSAPRTTATQEGLATLAELITDTMDLVRLRRIALRIKGLDAGLSGADFLQVFDIFRQGGQPDAEAFRSAARIFRGGDVRGGERPCGAEQLEGDDAVARYRKVMGATNPAEADEGTIRKAHAESIASEARRDLVAIGSNDN